MAELNVTAGSTDVRARELSNFQIRPFEFDRVTIKSPEGGIQGIKYPPGHLLREEAFASAGFKAKRLGEQAERKFVWWNEGVIPYGSHAHRTLIKHMIVASFTQNPYAYAVLHSTRGLTLVHDTGIPDPPNASLPREEFCRILTDLREREDLQTFSQSMSLLYGGLKSSLADIQAAAKVIEIDGIEGYYTAAARYGQHTALVLTTAHVRRNLSNGSYPPDPRVDEQVRLALRMHGILTD
ncbi:MAG TPA: hypothetical protein VFQ60_03065 [Patescibacteria group bacterium]|nr:hypothetical protein [Patescibacteria group bacterium]